MTERLLTPLQSEVGADSFPTGTLDRGASPQLLSAEDFDLEAFFETETRSDQDMHIAASDDNLVMTLRQEAATSITILEKTVTEEAFAKGAALTASIFSALGTLVGSCGVFCLHGVGSLAQGGFPLGGLGGAGSASLTSGRHETDLGGAIRTLAAYSGISESAIRSGSVDMDTVLKSVYARFGDGVNHLFGFGLISTMISCLFGNPHERVESLPQAA